MREGITRAMAISKDQLRQEALAAAHAKLRPAATGIEVVKGHPTDIGVEVALEAAWTVIEPLREAVKDWQTATGLGAVEIARLKAEVNEYAEEQWITRDAGTISDWRPPYTDSGNFDRLREQAERIGAERLQEVADKAREDWLRDRDG